MILLHGLAPTIPEHLLRAAIGVLNLHDSYQFRIRNETLEYLFTNDPEAVWTILYDDPYWTSRGRELERRNPHLRATVLAHFQP